jgi:hypothetical protein
MKGADLFDHPRREPLAVAHSRTVDLGGRAQLRLLLIEDEYGARRVMLGRSWEDDPVIQPPALFVRVEAVPELVAALQELAGEA